MKGETADNQSLAFAWSARALREAGRQMMERDNNQAKKAGGHNNHTKERNYESS